MERKNYNDFTLFELSHAMPDSMEGNKKDVIWLQKKIQQGKNFIDQEIRRGNLKKGDLVMLESAERYTIKHFRKEYDNKAWEWEPMWKPILKIHYNFYSAIARHAKKKGLKVENLEPGVYYPGSRLRTAQIKGETSDYSMFFDLMPKSEWRERFEHITTLRRDEHFLKKINARKPKLVICASGHAIYIEKEMEPKKAIFTTPEFSNPRERTNVWFYARRQRWDYRRKKLQRRAQINQQKGLKRKL